MFRANDDIMVEMLSLVFSKLILFPLPPAPDSLHPFARVGETGDERDLKTTEKWTGTLFTFGYFYSS
jgi:hypothetical protein